MSNESNGTIRTFEYSESGPGAYLIFVMKVDADESQAMKDNGFGGETYLYGLYGAHDQAFTYKARRFVNSFTSPEDNSLKSLLLELESGGIDLGDIEEGETLTPSKIGDLVGGPEAL